MLASATILPNRVCRRNRVGVDWASHEKWGGGVDVVANTRRKSRIDRNRPTSRAELVLQEESVQHDKQPVSCLQIPGIRKLETMWISTATGFLEGTRHFLGRLERSWPLPMDRAVA